MPGLSIDTKLSTRKSLLEFSLALGSLIIISIFECIISPLVIPRYPDIQLYRMLLLSGGVLLLVLSALLSEKKHIFQLLFLVAFMLLRLIEVKYFIPKLHAPGQLLSFFVFSNFIALFILVFYTLYTQKPLIAGIFLFFSLLYEFLYFKKLADLSPLVIMLVLAATGSFALISRLLKFEKEKKRIIEKMYREEKELKNKIALMRMRMLEQEKTFSLSMLTAGIAHELGNPINYLRGNLFFIKDHMSALIAILKKKKLNKDEKSIIEKVLSDSNAIFTHANTGFESMTNIINNMKSIYRGKNRTRERIPIKEILIKTVDFFKVSHRYNSYEIKIDVPPDLYICICPGEYYIVFSNILTNALEAIKTADRKGRILIKGYSNKNMVTVSISDNGCGISGNNKERVFDPFFSTKNTENNLGLGLALCKDIVEDDGGVLNIKSTKDSGTTVLLVLKECLDEA